MKFILYSLTFLLFSSFFHKEFSRVNIYFFCVEQLSNQLRASCHSSTSKIRAPPKQQNKQTKPKKKPHQKTMVFISFSIYWIYWRMDMERSLENHSVSEICGSPSPVILSCEWKSFEWSYKAGHFVQFSINELWSFLFLRRSLGHLLSFPEVQTFLSLCFKHLWVVLFYIYV